MQYNITEGKKKEKKKKQDKVWQNFLVKGAIPKLRSKCKCQNYNNYTTT